ncbi:acetylxylan esterase [Actinomycetaceae bacterium MB13-C1-2]|nr:acetylxylan esterase [Actinomycetaceae bacterium MB13-C1-2]
MAFFDLPIEQLRAYKPEVCEPADFDEFWRATLEENPAASEPLEIARVAEHLSTLDVFDLTIQGYGSQPIKAWYIRPRFSEPLGTVVSYIGYGGGRGFPEEHVSWATAGFSEVVVDSRGQGGSWSAGGDTPDQGLMEPSANGVMTRGISHPNNYYYRRLFVDAANAVVTARGLEGVDPSKMVTAGGSQGGALSIAAASLDYMRQDGAAAPLAGAIAAVPFLSHFERAIGLTNDYPYQEVVDYLNTRRNMVETVFNTLSYFDGVNFAKRIGGKGLYSVGLMDTVVPPSTVFASYNWFGGEAKIEVYPYNGHEGGGPYQVRREIEWLRTLVS